MDEINPYRPPEADLGTIRRPGRYRPLFTVVRVLVALWGLFILAGPPRAAPLIPSRVADIASKALGALLFLVAVFPFRKPTEAKAEAGPGETEDL
jgi:hypothetical protein